jgi:glycosyltransferase involved in cell wall biosynthesis
VVDELMTGANFVINESANADPVAQLANYRLVFIGSAHGETSVADYSTNFVEAVKPYFAEVIDHRVPGPGNATLADVRRHRRAVRDHIAAGPPGRVLVHAELSTGSMAPFWSIAGLKDVPVTGTVHDPPQGLWFVGRTRFIAKHRLLNHAIHYPLRPVSRAIEGVAYRDRTLFALTDAGRRSIEETYPRTRALYIPCMAFDRPAIKPVQDRPKAVGFFGYAYRGKGFDQIARIRELLPDDVLIRIAGRGTESLPKADGIEILGGVDGPEEDAFFESVRAIIVPYGKRHWYAETYPASGVGASAQSYCTPVISTGYGPLAELDEATGAVTVQPTAETDGVARALVEEITSLVNDRERLTHLGLNAEKTSRERSRAGTGKAFAEAWARLLDQTTASV